MVRVLVADDSELIRRGIRCLLEQHEDLQIVGEAADLAQTLQATCELNPDVIIADVYMPGRDESSLSRLAGCGVRIVAMSLANDSDTIDLARKMGSVVLLDKARLAADLIPALKRSVTSNGKSRATASTTGRYAESPNGTPSGAQESQ